MQGRSHWLAPSDSTSVQFSSTTASKSSTQILKDINVILSKPRPFTFQLLISRYSNNAPSSFYSSLLPRFNRWLNTPSPLFLSKKLPAGFSISIGIYSFTLRSRTGQARADRAGPARRNSRPCPPSLPLRPGPGLSTPPLPLRLKGRTQTLPVRRGERS